MNKAQAYKLIDKFYSNDNPSQEDEFIFVEAANYIIETENDANVMSSLGGFYYGKQKYALAEKYYLLADENGDEYASCGLGFIYYYGRNGERDFSKAFYYYNKSMGFGNMESAMKIADMYHNGFGVEKNEAKYKEILESIFNRIKDTDRLFDPYPEVAHRLSDIYISERKIDITKPMLTKAKSFITQRIRYSPFWGNFIVCKRVIELYYKVFPFDKDNLFLSFFDFFHLFKSPHKVKCIYNGKEYLIESFFDEGAMRVKCNNVLYKSTEDFLTNAMFENKHVYIIEYDYDFRTLQIIE